MTKKLRKTAKYGLVAQLGERSVRIREVEGSNPFESTKRTKSELLPNRGRVRICSLLRRNSSIKQRPLSVTDRGRFCLGFIFLLPAFKSRLPFRALEISLDCGEQTTGKGIYNILRDNVLLFILRHKNALNQRRNQSSSSSDQKP